MVANQGHFLRSRRWQGPRSVAMRKRRARGMLMAGYKAKYLLAAAVLTAVASPGYAASFDCAKAASPIETAICGDAKLGALDVQLTTEFKAAMTREANNRASLLMDQRKWLRDRNAECSGQNPSANLERTVGCLAAAYTKRIAQMKATPSICEKLASPISAIIKEAVRGPIPGLYFEWPRILAKRPESGITIREPLASFQYSNAELTKQIRPLPNVAGNENLAAMDDKLKEQVSGFDEGSRMTLDLLAPDENLYVLEVPQGSQSCDADIYFRVANGEARLADDAHVEDAGVDGAVCEKERFFGAADHVSAIIDDEGPSSWSIRDIISIRLREHNAWTPACSIQLDFAPRFTLDHTPGHNQRSSGNDCKGPICGDLRKAGLKLIEMTQSDPNGVEGRLVSTLSLAEHSYYERMKSLYKPDDQGAEAVTELNPLLLPVIAERRIFIAAVGRQALGDEVRQDWVVEFYQLKAATLDQVAQFGIDTDPGRLLHVTTGWQEDEDDN
jgi:uncharacterized protein